MQDVQATDGSTINVGHTSCTRHGAGFLELGTTGIALVL
jgi:hypothetical protein